MRRAAGAALVLLALFGSGCGASNASQPGTASEPDRHRTLADIVASESPSLFAIPGVQSVREGRDEDGNPCIVVLVDKVTAEMKKRIPSRLQNVPVVIEPAMQPRAADAH